MSSKLLKLTLNIAHTNKTQLSPTPASIKKTGVNWKFYAHTVKFVCLLIIKKIKLPRTNYCWNLYNTKCLHVWSRD